MLPTANVVTSGYYSVSALVEMGLPGYPRSPKGWYGLVERENWAFREVEGRGGKTGTRREYKAPPEVVTLIEQRQRGELPPPPEKPASRPGIEPLLGVSPTVLPGDERSSHVPAQAAPMMAPADTTEMVSRCLAAAARVMQDRFTPEQHVSLGIDTWGALRRMFHGREAENIGCIADTDIDQLARFILNTKRALNTGAK